MPITSAAFCVAVEVNALVWTVVIAGKAERTVIAPGRTSLIDRDVCAGAGSNADLTSRAIAFRMKMSRKVIGGYEDRN